MSKSGGSTAVRVSRFLALLFLGCPAACATSIPLGRVDQLARATGARTILLEQQFALYSPYDLIRTRAYLERIETGRAEVFGLFEVESEQPLTVWLRVDPELGVHASVEGDRMRIESVSMETHDGVLGEAEGSVVVIRVAPLDVVTLSDGRTITGTFDVSMYDGTIRHELAHAAAFLLGVYGKGWLKEGLAHVVEWIPIEGGRLKLDPVPEELRRAAGLPAELRSLDRLLAWEQALPPTDDDRAARLLACSLVAFLLEWERAPRFRDGILHIAALDDARILALQDDWSTWLDGFASADPAL
jgi:hypothetical protein